MATNAKVGIGTILNKWDDSLSTPAWVEIVEVTALGWGGSSRTVIEVFKLNNADDFVNKLQGILNAGSITATINFTKAGFILLKADHETRGNVEYQIVFPDGEGLEFAGFISELPLDFNSDDVMQGEITIEIDGKADFVSSASASP